MIQEGNSSTTYQAGAESKLAFFWPNLYYQDDSGLMQQYFYWGSNWSQAQAPYSVRGLIGSSLALIPRNINYTGLTLFYQRDDQKLIEYHWDQGGATPGYYLGTLPMFCGK